VSAVPAIGEPVAVDPVGAGPRRDELPVGRDVVSFPDGCLPAAFDQFFDRLFATAEGKFFGFRL
jgi:hypothetical protein